MEFHSQNKKIVVVAIVLLLLTSAWFYYRYYNSIENQTRRETVRKATEWFSSYSLKNVKGTKESIEIKMTRATHELNDDWRFVFENWEVHEATYSDYLIDHYYFFKNQNTGEMRMFSTQYYFDLDLPEPIPLKSHTTVINGDHSDIIDKKFLWEGDFDVFCKQP